MELGHSTAVTLATHAANILAQAEDLVIFQGANAISNSSLFAPTPVLGVAPPALALSRPPGPSDTGLLNLGPFNLDAAPVPAAGTFVQVAPQPGQSGVYASNTFQQVAKAYAMLQGNGQYGPTRLSSRLTPMWIPLPRLRRGSSLQRIVLDL
jgi:hypothetical protein